MYWLRTDPVGSKGADRMGLNHASDGVNTMPDSHSKKSAAPGVSVFKAATFMGSGSATTSSGAYHTAPKSPK